MAVNGYRVVVVARQNVSHLIQNFERFFGDDRLIGFSKLMFLTARSSTFLSSTFISGQPPFDFRPFTFRTFVVFVVNAVAIAVSWAAFVSRYACQIRAKVICVNNAVAVTVRWATFVGSHAFHVRAFVVCVVNAVAVAVSRTAFVGCDTGNIRAFVISVNDTCLCRGQMGSPCWLLHLQHQDICRLCRKHRLCRGQQGNPVASRYTHNIRAFVVFVVDAVFITVSWTTHFSTTPGTSGQRVFFVCDAVSVRILCFAKFEHEVQTSHRIGVVVVRIASLADTINVIKECFVGRSSSFRFTRSVRRKRSPSPTGMERPFFSKSAMSLLRLTRAAVVLLL